MVEWKTIPGFDGRYEISDCGQLRSYARSKEPRQLRQTLNKFGYFYVNLRGLDGKAHYRPVSALVLLAFMGEPNDGVEAAHVDGNKTNNFLSNLVWKTPLENDKDKDKHGTRLMGEKCPWSKLTKEQVMSAVAMRNSGMYYKDIAKNLGVAYSTAYAILTGRMWSSVTGIEQRKRYDGLGRGAT